MERTCARPILFLEIYGNDNNQGSCVKLFQFDTNFKVAQLSLYGGYEIRNYRLNIKLQ